MRVTPQAASNMQHSYDFVELCGSDLAASLDIPAVSRESEKDRKFASESFNCLSKLLIAQS